MARSFAALLCLALVGAPAVAGEPVAPLDVAADADRVLAKCDPALRKLDLVRRKVEFVCAAAAKPLDAAGFDAATVRLRDAATDLDKARDDLRAVVVELRLAALKYALTGRHDRQAARFTTFADTIQRLIGDRDPKTAPFAKAAEALAALGETLDKRANPNAASLEGAEKAVAAFFDATRDSAYAIESEWATGRLIATVREIRDRQEKIRTDIDKLFWAYVPPVLEKDPVIGAAEPIVLEKQGTATVKHTIGWNQYKEDEIVVKVTASDSSLTVPAALKLDFEKHQFRFEYELKGGNKAGEFTVTLTPAAGKSVVVKVSVK